MKKLLLLSLFACSLALGSQAQVTRSSKPSQRMQSDSSRKVHMQQMKDLNLTKDQKDQMKAMRQDAKSQRAAIQNDASLTPDQKKAKMKDMEQSFKTKRNSILTPDQISKMKEMKKQNHQGKKWGKKGQGKNQIKKDNVQ